MITFESGFAKDILSFLDYREALGFSRRTHEPKLRNFDLFCKEFCPETSILTKELVLAWLEDQHSQVLNTATAIHLLGNYQVSIGENSYILYDKYIAKSTNDAAYI